MDIGPDPRRIYVIPTTPPVRETTSVDDAARLAATPPAATPAEPFLFGLSRRASTWLLTVVTAGMALYMAAGTPALPVIAGLATLWVARYRDELAAAATDAAPDHRH